LIGIGWIVFFYFGELIYDFIELDRSLGIDIISFAEGVDESLGLGCGESDRHSSTRDKTFGTNGGSDTITLWIRDITSIHIHRNRSFETHWSLFFLAFTTLFFIK
jgi:hypothetical protein